MVMLWGRKQIFACVAQERAEITGSGICWMLTPPTIREKLYNIQRHVSFVGFALCFFVCFVLAFDDMVCGFSLSSGLGGLGSGPKVAVHSLVTWGSWRQSPRGQVA